MTQAYADDIDIISVEAAFSKFAEKARNIGLAVNESKTNYLSSTAKDSRGIS